MRYPLSIQKFISPLIAFIFFLYLFLIPTLFTSNNVKAETPVLVNQNSESNSMNPLVTVEIIIGSILVIGGIGAVIISKSGNKKIQDMIYRDSKRKHDIEKIRYSLSAFAKTYGRYPNSQKGEYTELLEQLNPIPIDPFADKDTGFNHQKYNYYYDNQSLNTKEKGRENTMYYRLWCHLENAHDPDINHLYNKSYRNIYLKTSTDPLNPTLLEDPVKHKQEVLKNPDIPEVATIEHNRQESLIRFLLLIVGFGLLISAIINGILYYLVIQK